MNRRDFVTAAAVAACGVASTGVGESAVRQLAGVSRLTPPANELIRVACAISKGTTEIDFIGPQAVFESWHRDPVTRRPSPKFRIFTVAETKDPVDARLPDYTFADVPAPHVVIVPAQSGSPALLEWLKKVHTTADVTMSVCVGASHLAKAGLLDGQTATTHHESIDQFEKQYTAVKWIRRVRFVENGRIATAGGLTSGIDLALHVVDRYFGREAARGVAEHLEYESTRWMV